MARMPRTLGAARLDAGEFDKLRRARKPSRRWYCTAAWRARRLDQLARAPWCALHLKAGGAMVLATVADHVVPHRENAKLFWYGELQSLCASCHSSIKQRQEAR